MSNRRSVGSWPVILVVVFLAVLVTAPVQAGGEEPLRLGLIGLDTSHVVAFTRLINDPQSPYGCKVVAGFPGGSPDVEASASRVEQFTAQLRDRYGVEIVKSIEDLCTKVDGVLLESVDGRPHLRQVRPVIAAGLPVFIDKPMAGSLADVLEIFRLAKAAGVPCWSSSSLRYALGIQAMKAEGKTGPILGCDVYSPCALEEHHPDLYWYGVHGVEILYTLMGTGCQSVSRVHTEGWDVVVGRWADGRIATFRGIRQGKGGYGATVYGRDAIVVLDQYAGYKPLVDEVVKFFKTGQVPVLPEETIELFAFMTAADESKARGGQPVDLAEVIQRAQQRAGHTQDKR